jgi:hypothetical protein
MNCTLVAATNQCIRRVRCTVRSLVIELAAQCFVATAAAAVVPLHLDQPIVGAEGLVVGAVSERTRDRPELPGAFVRALVARRVIPVVQVWIGDHFGGPVQRPYHRHRRRRSGVTVCISQADGQRSGSSTNANLMSVPPIVLLLCQPQYLVQNPELSATADDVLNVAIGALLPPAVVISRGGKQRDILRGVASGIAVGRVDLEVARAADPVRWPKQSIHQTHSRLGCLKVWHRSSSCHTR